MFYPNKWCLYKAISYSAVVLAYLYRADSLYERFIVGHRYKTRFCLEIF